MFLPIEFASVNHDHVLPPGVYTGACSHYVGRGRKALQAFVFEYRLDAATSPSVCDLVVVDADGSLRARDFVWLPDRSWRDSDGLTANDLRALLAPELLALRLSNATPLPSIEVRP